MSWTALALVTLACAPAALASAVFGTGGAITLSDGPNAEGLSMSVRVNYQVFSGTSASDPLGITPGRRQYAYLLEYLAGNEHLSTLDIESTAGEPLLATGTATTGSVNGVAAGTTAPSASGIITLPSGNTNARFIFSDSDQQAQFGLDGARSVILVYTADADSDIGYVTAGVRDASLSAAGQVRGPVPHEEGCSPEFWKNNCGRWPWPYRPWCDFDSTFGVNAFHPNISLQTALCLRAARAFVRWRARPSRHC